MNLDDIRVQIDDIDGQLIDLFTRRMNAVRDVARYKAEHGLPVLDRSRERAVLMKVSEQAGPELRQYAKILYGALFDVSRSYQRGALGVSSPLTDQIRRALDHTPAAFPARATVACQGAEGAYSQQACDKLFATADLLYFRSFEGVFSAVEGGLCEFGVLPIENSSYGSVSEVYDLMRRHKFYIVRSIRLRMMIYAAQALGPLIMGAVESSFGLVPCMLVCAAALALSGASALGIGQGTQTEAAHG